MLDLPIKWFVFQKENGNVLYIDSVILQYPYCTSLDIQELLNGSMYTPTQIFFNLKKLNNATEKLYFSFYVEDKNKKLTKRPSKSNMLAYLGPDISQSLENPSSLKLMISIKQFIDPEDDEKKKCKNYPYGGFSTYHECDEDFVLQTFNKIHNGDILPFWVAKDFDRVTRLRCPFKWNKIVQIQSQARTVRYLKRRTFCSLTWHMRDGY